MGHPEVQDLKGAQLIGPAVETVDLLEQAFILYKKGRSNDGTVGLLERRDAYEQVERTPPRPGVLDPAVSRLLPSARADRISSATSGFSGKRVSADFPATAFCDLPRMRSPEGLTLVRRARESKIKSPSKREAIKWDSRFKTTSVISDQ